MAVDPGGTGAISGFDHIALPMQETDRMADFYRSLGLRVTENEHVVRVHAGDQMINFHRPHLWQQGFALRAPAAQPPCGDLCLRWQGSTSSLQELLAGVGVAIVEGPVRREGGRGADGTSIYVRDPDGNLLEFMAYERH